jgi:hypothetical protein
MSDLTVADEDACSMARNDLPTTGNPNTSRVKRNKRGKSFSDASTGLGVKQSRTLTMKRIMDIQIHMFMIGTGRKTHPASLGDFREKESSYEKR